MSISNIGPASRVVSGDAGAPGEAEIDLLAQKIHQALVEQIDNCVSPRTWVGETGYLLDGTFDLHEVARGILSPARKR